MSKISLVREARSARLCGAEHRAFSLSALAILVAGIVGCQKEKPAEAPAAAKPAAVASTEAAAGTRKMANCPSAVAGAKTEISDAPDAVVVTVLGSTEEATGQIRARAHHLAALSAKEGNAMKHDGEGGGGGGAGNCPVVTAASQVTSEDVPNGARLTIKPNKADDLAKLKQAASDRNAKLSLR